jgi:peptidylprolyl isomerase
MRTLLLAAVAAAFASAANAQAPVAPARAAPAAADWRTPDPNDVLIIDTNKGRIFVEMVPEVAPTHVARVRELAREGLYNGRTFFRVIDGFMAQTGDPQDNGQGASEKPNLEPEFMFRRGADMPFVLAFDQAVAEQGFVKSLPVTTQSMMLAPMTRDGRVAGFGQFCRGVAGMARGSEENSANAQFFLMRDRYPSLERRYTPWGRVIAGQDAVGAIKTGEPVAAPQDRMERVRVLADLPEAERPKVRVIDPNGAWFKAEIARVRNLKGAEFSACDVNLPSEVK